MFFVVVDQSQKIQNNEKQKQKFQQQLSFMLEAKSLGHGLYEISRNHEFMHDMYDIMKIGESKQQQLYFILFGDNGKASQQALSMLLFCYSNEINLTSYDKNGMNAIHYAAESGNYKLMQLIFSYFKDKNELINKIINIKKKDSYEMALHFAQKSKQNVAKGIEVILKDGYGIKDSKRFNVLYSIICKRLYRHHDGMCFFFFLFFL